jgi:hypothetical protein
MLPFLLVACGPGQLDAWGESELLRSAWVLQEENTEAMGLLLSTSEVPCALNQNTEPSGAILETQSLVHVFTREGSRLIWVPLGELTIREKEPHSVSARYFEVVESELLWTNRLTAAYRPTEIREEIFQGELTLDSLWTGMLALDAGGLSARFRAEICTESDLFLILGLLEVE